MCSSADARSRLCSKQYPPRRLATSFRSRSGLLQRDRDAAVGVEVLERDRRRVRPVDRLPGRLVRRVQANPAEIRVEIEHQANGTEAQTVRPVPGAVNTTCVPDGYLTDGTWPAGWNAIVYTPPCADSNRDTCLASSTL